MILQVKYIFHSGFLIKASALTDLNRVKIAFEAFSLQLIIYSTMGLNLILTCPAVDCPKTGLTGILFFNNSQFYKF